MELLNSFKHLYSAFWDHFFLRLDRATIINNFLKTLRDIVHYKIALIINFAFRNVLRDPQSEIVINDFFCNFFQPHCFFNNACILVFVTPLYCIECLVCGLQILVDTHWWGPSHLNQFTKDIPLVFNHWNIFMLIGGFLHHL